MSQAHDLLLVGGTVVTGAGMRRADIGVKGETIAAIQPSLPREGAREVLDVSGKYIFPGIIDVHVHPVYLDDVEACSRIAAYGGTTTLLHFAYARTGDSLLQKVEEMLHDAQRRSLLDFGLHGGMFEAPKQVPEIPRVMTLGVRTFKFFLTYLKQGWYTDDYQLIKAMDILAEHNGMAIVHCENGGAIDYLEDKFLKGPQASARFFNASRPPALEEEGIFRAIRLAEVVGCRVYIPHVTAKRALRPIRMAQEEGLPVYAETCPQYLNLTESILETRGALAKIGPPIRTAQDSEALWVGLRDGTLSVVASDHAPKAKDVSGDFLMQGFGSPQIETLLPVTYDGGVNRGHISVVRLVQVLCENPARIFGLYPRKGTLAAGSDADLVVFDPNREFTIQADNQHSNVGYTLYEGLTTLGWPMMSFQRGKRVLWQGEIQAQPGQGRFLPTLESPADPILS
ncbi:MAG: amidohydrolase family protein [Caldilineaceae bacterium]|nr:amidohydrolase family protein [Caldilineaceae bacterium]